MVFAWPVGWPATSGTWTRPLETMRLIVSPTCTSTSPPASGSERMTVPAARSIEYSAVDVPYVRPAASMAAIASASRHAGDVGDVDGRPAR